MSCVNVTGFTEYRTESQHPQSSEVQGRFSSKQETALESREHLPEVMEGVSRNLNEWKLRFCVCVLDPMSSSYLVSLGSLECRPRGAV